MGCPSHRSYGPIRVSFWASCSWQSEGLFGQSSSIAPPGQALKGLSCLGCFSAGPASGAKRAPLVGVPLCRLACQALKGALWAGSCSVVSASGVWWASLYCSAADDAGLWGERGYGWFHLLGMTQQYCLASMAAQLSFTGISHHSLLPHIPLILLSAVSLQPSPWDCSTVPKLQFLAAAPSWGPASASRVCIAAARTVWFLSHLGCHDQLFHSQT